MTSEPSSSGLSAPLADLADALSALAGARIALIAPAGGVRDERIDTALAVLAAAGIDARLGAHARAHHRYLAGTAAERLADLHAAFDTPDVDAVWCLRGGYGSAHLLARIDWSRIADDVPIVGYSDISTLLEAFRQRGRRAIHAPVATELALPGEAPDHRAERRASMQSLARVLAGAGDAWPLTHVAGPAHAVTGRLVGGNLTTLASLAGTPAALRLQDDAILVLEDVGEAEFRLERCFHQLLESVDTDQLTAVCLGRFERCDLAAGMDSLIDMLGEATTAHAIPLYAGAPVGHGPLNHAWPYGPPATVEDGQLTFAGSRNGARRRAAIALRGIDTR